MKPAALFILLCCLAPATSFAQLAPATGFNRAPDLNQRHGKLDIPGFPRHGETESVFLDGRIVTMSGISAWGQPTFVTSYDLVSGSWTYLPDLPMPLHHTAAVSDGVEHIYVMGGAPNFWYQFPPFQTQDKLYIYSHSTRSWSQGPDMPAARLGHDALWFDGKIYVMAGEGLDAHAQGQGQHGQQGHHVDTHVLIYDPARRQWTQGAAIPTHRHHVAAFLLNDLIYVVGGRPGHEMSDSSVPTVEVYDPRQDSWRSAPDFPHSAFNGGTTLNINGTVYAFGGEGPEPRLSFLGALGGLFWTVNKDIYRFEPNGERWTKVGQMKQARHGMGGVVFDNRAFLIAGTSGPMMLSPLTPVRTLEWFRP